MINHIAETLASIKPHQTFLLYNMLSLKHAFNTVDMGY